jgi:hypothetical protein
VFTEYRDTLERLRHALAGAGHHATLLHGDMTPQERCAAQREFNSTGALLLATDAASEGLNLHHRCRMVIHFELPWNPSRLEQRTGRVDRIGQERVVHEIILVADDSSERLVLAPLMRRSARAGAAFQGASRLFHVLSESRVAGAVLEGAAVDPVGGEIAVDCAFPPAQLQAAARAEAIRLTELRLWSRRGGGDAGTERVLATALPATRPALRRGVVWIHTCAIASSDGNTRNSELIATNHQLPAPLLRLTPSDIRRSVVTLRSTLLPAIEQWIHERMAARFADLVRAVETLDQASDDRERIVAASRRSTAQRLVQGGLFERRTRRIDAASGDSTEWDELGREGPHRPAGSNLTTRLTLSAILFVATRQST